MSAEIIDFRQAVERRAREAIARRRGRLVEEALAKFFPTQDGATPPGAA